MSARALFILVALTLFTLPLIPLQMLFNGLNLEARRTLPVFWHKVTARLIGLKIQTKGTIAANRPLLIASNHMSWLDIVTLSSCGPVSFIAKREVAGWPGFGWLAKLQRTVFVNRERPSATGDKTSEIAERLTMGDVMVLFAEGTSTCGSHVQPFRSALFGAAQKAVGTNETIWIQPVAITYTHLDGMLISRAERYITGYYGDMNIATHLLRLLKHTSIDATVSFGDPVSVITSTNRKTLAASLEKTVRTMKTEALHGSRMG